MDRRACTKKMADANVSIVESVALLAKDIEAPEALMDNIMRPRGQGRDREANQLAAISVLLVEVTYATGVRDRPEPEPEPEPDASEDLPTEPPEPPEPQPILKQSRKSRRSSKG